MRKLIAIFGFLLFFHLLFFDNFFIFPGSLGFAVFILGIQSFLFLIFWKENFLKIFQEGVIFSLFSLILAWLGLLKGDREFVGSLLWLGSISLTSLSLYIYVAKDPKLRSSFELILIPLRLGKSFLNSFFSKRKSFSLEIPLVTRGIGAGGVPLARGLIIALPILIILLLILTAADPIFRKIFENTFWFLSDLSHLARRIIVTLILLCLLVPIVDMVIENYVAPKFEKPSAGRFAIEALVVVGLVVLFLGWFLLVQLRYLFTNVSEVQLYQFGVKTYSEYVSKGFGELLFASIFIYLIVGGSLYIFRYIQGEESKWLKYFNLILIGELFLLFLSVFRRLVLYQQFHGMTVARVYGIIFLVWLGAMAAILIGRHFKQQRWVFYEIGVSIAVLLLIGFVNVERIIVSLPPTVNNEVDEVYLSRLSPDGYLGWKSSYIWAQDVYDSLKDNETINAENNRKLIYALSIINNLDRNYRKLFRNFPVSDDYVPPELISENQKADWHNFNYSEWMTFSQMAKEMPYTEIIKLSDGLQKITARVSERTRTETPMDRAPGQFIVR